MNIGSVKLTLFLNKETFEVEVICAQEICPGEREEPGKEMQIVFLFWRLENFSLCPLYSKVLKNYPVSFDIIVFKYSVYFYTVKNSKKNVVLIIVFSNASYLIIHLVWIVSPFPDTYVKTYLRDGEQWLQKRKTRVIKHSRNPQYQQTLTYESRNALGRNLLIMLWEKKQGFESNQGLGGVEVDLKALPSTKCTGVYPLFPIHTLGTQNADSPWWLREKWALEPGELDLRLGLLLKNEGESVIKIISW